jgi:hypothetical protein
MNYNVTKACKEKQTIQTPTELIQSIPPPPRYHPLPYCQINRSPIVRITTGIKTDPYSLFKLFITDKHFETIASNTNKYAKSKEAGSCGKRSWWPTTANEIQVFIAIFIYMGVVHLRAYADYWSTKYRQFLCTKHMSLNHFEDLKRFIHICLMASQTLVLSAMHGRITIL